MVFGLFYLKIYSLMMPQQRNILSNFNNLLIKIPFLDLISSMDNMSFSIIMKKKLPGQFTKHQKLLLQELTDITDITKEFKTMVMLIGNITHGENILN